LAADVSNTAHLLVQLRVFHPIVAAVVAAYTLFSMGFVGLQQPSLRKAARVVMGLVALQVAAGFVNVALLAPVWMQIVHLLLADLVWIALVVVATASAGEEAGAKVAGAVEASKAA
jgi:heme A synthase